MLLCVVGVSGSSVAFGQQMEIRAIFQVRGGVLAAKQPFGLSVLVDHQVLSTKRTPFLFFRASCSIR